MPAPYLHYAVARDSFTHLPPEFQTQILPRLPVYFFGAQGADFCFLHPSTNALGRLLHRNGYDFFKLLALLSQTSRELFAYSLGYIAHYAADCVFHPFVYHLSGSSLLKHSRVESALDGYFRAADEADPFRCFLRPKLREKDLDELFLPYAAYAAKTGKKPLSKAAFQHAVALFNAYTGTPFPRRERISVATLENREKRLWTNPKAPETASCDGAKELYAKAVAFTLSHALEFDRSVKEKRCPSRTAFSKNFLSGF